MPVEPVIPAWIPRLARILDSQFRIPGTRWRFGWETILGLVPVVGTP